MAVARAARSSSRRAIKVRIALARARAARPRHKQHACPCARAAGRAPRVWIKELQIQLFPAPSLWARPSRGKKPLTLGAAGRDSQTFSSKLCGSPLLAVSSRSLLTAYSLHTPRPAGGRCAPPYLPLPPAEPRAANDGLRRG
jgi:hypothetical protein